jgi:hypothetical protein
MNKMIKVLGYYQAYLNRTLLAQPLHYLAKKIADGRRVDNNAEYKTKQGSKQVGVMIDIIRRLFSLVIGVGDIQCAQNKTRHAK